MPTPPTKRHGIQTPGTSADPYAAYMDEPYWEKPSYPHVLLNQTTQLPGCGCTVVGHGILPSPVMIRYCPTHAAALAMLADVQELFDSGYLDDGANAVVPFEAINRLRALLATLDQTGA